MTASASRLHDRVSEGRGTKMPRRPKSASQSQRRPGAGTADDFVQSHRIHLHRVIVTLNPAMITFSELVRVRRFVRLTAVTTSLAPASPETARGAGRLTLLAARPGAVTRAQLPAAQVIDQGDIYRDAPAALQRKE
jgi:hypothetical protein